MAFPGGLSPRVDLMYSGQWQDITTDVLSRDASNSIVVTRGRQTEDATITPSTCALQLRNRDGKYSPRNPNSPLFGLIGRNTPVRVGVGRPPVAAAARSSVSSTSIVAPSVTAEASGLLIGAWAAQPGGGALTLPGGFTAQTETGTPCRVNTGYQAGVGAGATGTKTATYSLTATTQAAALVHVPGASFSSVVQSTGAGGADVAVTPTILAGQFAVVVCVWSSDDESRMQPPKIQGDQGQNLFLLADSGSDPNPLVPRVMMWGWNCPTSSPGPISLAGVRDSAGSAFLRVYTLTGAQAYYPRFVGEISEFPVQWDKRGADVFVPVTASGVTRRLVAPGQDSLRSAIYQAFVSRPGQIAYWPMEDAAGTAFSNAITGGQLGTFAPGGPSGNAPPQLAASSAFPGSEPVPTFTSAGALLPVSGYTPTGVLSAGVLVAISNGGTANGANLFVLECTGGNVACVVMEYENATTVRLRIVYNDGTGDFTQSTAVSLDGKKYVVFVTLTTNGSSLDWQMRFVDFTTDLNPPLLFLSGTRTTTSLGKVRRMTVGVEYGTGNTLHTNAPAFGHAFITTGPSNTVFNSQDDLGASSTRALNAWQSEKVHDRVRRLCTQQSVLSAVQHNAISEVLGAQLPNTFIDLISEAEATDAGGQLFEPTGFLGFAYRTRVWKEAQVPRLTFDYAAGTLMAPLVPTDDDRSTVNDVTVTRVGGASARAEKRTGALSTQAPPNGVGRYAQAYELSLFTDAQCADQASWRLSLGTIDAARWPSITFHLGAAGNAAKIVSMAHLDIGDMIRLSNLPAWVPPGPTDLLLEGYTEHIGFTDWVVEANLSPAAGYAVGYAGAAGWDRVGDDGAATLAAGVSSSATALSVATASGPRFTTTATPFAITVAGEEMTVTAVGPDGTFETGVSDWVVGSGTVVQSTAQVRSGTYSALLTVTGAPSQTTLRQISSLRSLVVVGQSYTAEAWVYSASGTSVAIQIDWRQSDATLISTSSSGAIALPAGVWMPISVTGTAPALAALANYGPSIVSSPAAGTAIYVDDVSFTAPQTFTVTRSVNGIVKSQSAGAAVTVARAAITAL